MLSERLSFNGAPTIGFGSPIITDTPTAVFAVPLFAIPLAATGAVVGHFIKKGTGTAAGAVVGGVVGGALGWWGTTL
jgi:hypothetical protein